MIDSKIIVHIFICLVLFIGDIITFGLIIPYLVSATNTIFVIFGLIWFLFLIPCNYIMFNFLYYSYKGEK